MVVLHIECTTVEDGSKDGFKEFKRGPVKYFIDGHEVPQQEFMAVFNLWVPDASR